jgi:hypothetical protein
MFVALLISSPLWKNHFKQAHQWKRLVSKYIPKRAARRWSAMSVNYFSTTVRLDWFYLANSQFGIDRKLTRSFLFASNQCIRTHNLLNSQSLTRVRIIFVLELFIIVSCSYHYSLTGKIIRECELVSIGSLSFARFRIRYASVNLYPILKALRGHLLNFSPTDAPDIEENVLPNSNDGQELQSAVIQHASMASVLAALFPESSSSASQFLSALTSLSDSEIASLNVFLPVFGLLPTGDFHHELEIENDCDSSNCFSVHFHGNLSFQARLQALEIFMVRISVGRIMFIFYIFAFILSLSFREENWELILI